MVYYYKQSINRIINFLSCVENQHKKVMKKLLGLALVLLCFTACSDDDTPKTPSVNTDQLVKRWFYSATRIGNASEPYQNLPCGKDYIEFQAGNAVKTNDWFDCQQDPTIANGTYTLNEETKVLTTVIDGNTEIYTITKLNSKELEAETSVANAKVTFIFTSTP